MSNEKRLIDANALKELVIKEIRHYWNYGESGYYLAEDVVPDIDNAPTVDAVEVVHGGWIDAREYCGDYMCSNCDALYGTNKFNYCPNCGAKMDGERKDNEV